MTMAKPALLMTGPMMPLIEHGCDAAFTVHRLHKAADCEALVGKVAPEIRAICTGVHTGVQTDDAFMGRFPNLKIVGNFGVGYDTVDAAAAARRGVIVTNTPEVLTEEVADTTLGLLLATVRELCKAEKWLRDGRWATGRLPVTRLARDCSAGIAGLGRIGKAIAALEVPARQLLRRSRSRTSAIATLRRPPWRAMSTR
jgi:lactate dehydrogenase-like 2-hydroxyacid dehydrogenase